MDLELYLTLIDVKIYLGRGGISLFNLLLLACTDYCYIYMHKKIGDQQSHATGQFDVGETLKIITVNFILRAQTYVCASQHC